MKKLSAFLLALILVFATMVSAFAAGINSSEQAVIDKLSESVTMNGVEMVCPSEFVNQAENYFNTIDMTEEESAEIIAIIDEGQNYLESTGASNISYLTLDQKQVLLDYGQEVVGVIGMTATYDKSTKILTICDPNGDVAFSSQPTLVPAGSAGNSGNSGVIKTTGAEADFSGFAVAGVAVALVFAGSAVYFVKSKKEA